MKHKVLVICGPTATGKTDLALRLAKKFNGEIISADSRQVYKGMDIGTGKDIGNFKFQSASWRTNFKFRQEPLSYYDQHGIRIWGYDVVNPRQDWSPADFADMATKLIVDIQKRRKLPIVVGGSGFYLSALFSPPKTMSIRPNTALREKLNKKSVEELQKQLIELNKGRFALMNYSDQRNPRRLIRAIEIAISSAEQKADCHLPDIALRLSRWRAGAPSSGTRNDKQNPSVLWIGLTADIQVLDNRIADRVFKRVQQGVQKEVTSLVHQCGWNKTLSSTIAYKEWRQHFEAKETIGKTIETWITHEKQYARRQLIWFKKQPKIHWFDISTKDCVDDIVHEVCQWYDEIKKDKHE